jgi:hypothetical protein
MRISAASGEPVIASVHYSTEVILWQRNNDAGCISEEILNSLDRG